jgi:predicted nucleotidyltransferase
LIIESDLRWKIAKEAATLLYFGTEKEYKQAKIKGARTFGVNLLPSNLEVAVALDKIAEEIEGPARKERLIQMRKEALKILRLLKDYSLFLIGSVWRGTIRKGSDIDIVLYHDVTSEILELLKRNGFKISKADWVSVNKRGRTETSFHIYFFSGKQRVELVVRSSEEAKRKRKCEIFGDEIKGLNVQELERLLKENPVQKFFPV